MNWNEQTVVLTGAYGGLGKSLAKTLIKLGAHLILTGRDLTKLQLMSKSLPKRTILLSGDVTSVEFHNQLIEMLKVTDSKGHVLINNAGISRAGFLNTQNNQDIRQMLEVNLLAPILLSKALIPWLNNAKSAHIINIGSTFGAIGYPGFSGYCATKFGLRGFSQALGRELVDTTISVNYLAPRAIATDINSDNVNQLNKTLKNNVDSVEKLIPLIIRAIEKNQSELFFGWPEKLFTKINAVFPKLVTKSIVKQHKTIKQFLNK